MRKFFFLLLLLTGFLPTYSIDIHWDLEPLVIKNGVGNNTIYHVCYGSEGFMWFSTDKGISRYDGFRFRDYPLIMSIDSLCSSASGCKNAEGSSRRFILCFTLSGRNDLF